jgi:hypothetical protein
MPARFLALVAATLAATAPAQPPDPPRRPSPFGVPDPVTAFPEIQPPKPVPPKDGSAGPGPTATLPIILGSTPRPVPACAPVLVKLRTARLNELAEYIRLAYQVIGLGRFTPDDMRLLLAAIDEAGLTGADLEDTNAARVRWYEDRLRGLKDVERMTEWRVDAGEAQPELTNLARARRLSAELDLLRARRLATADPRPIPPLPNPVADPKAEPFTAFPGLKPVPPTFAKPEDQLRDGVEKFLEWQRAWERTLSPIIDGRPIPSEPTDDLRRKVLKARFNAGLAAYQKMWADQYRSICRFGTPTAAGEFVSSVTLAGADLEDSVAARVPWYEMRVRLLWDAARFLQARVEAGLEPPQLLHRARAARLAAEIDLLRAKERAGRVAVPAAIPANPLPAAKTNLVFTAFPELKARVRSEQDDPSRPVYDPETRKRLPAGAGLITPYPAGASIEMTLRIGRANDGLVHLLQTREMITVGRWIPDDTPVLLGAVAATMRARADLEADPAERERWLARWVVEAKDVEWFTAARVEAGRDPPQLLDLVRFHRLGAELELIDFRTPRLPPPAVLPCPAVVVYPQSVFVARGGFLRRR